MSGSHPTSCTSCGARRIQCDEARPVCVSCHLEERNCSYDWTLGEHIFGLFPQTANLNSMFQIDIRAYQAGEGTFARVYRTEMSDGRAIAVKVFFENKWLLARALELSVREAWTWSQLRHTCLVPLLGLANYAQVCAGAIPQLCLVSPWMTEGNIMEYLEKHTAANRLHLAGDIAKGVEYLHTRKGGPVIHGDLKGNNILIHLREGRPRACITDFGLAHVMDSMGASAMQTTSTSDKGNSRWLAFERMFPRKYGIGHLPDAKSIHSDVFEMMRTFLQIFTGRIPYCGLGDWEVFRMVDTEQNPELPSNMAPEKDMSPEMWDELSSRMPSVTREKAKMPSAQDKSRIPFMYDALRTVRPAGPCTM